MMKSVVGQYECVHRSGIGLDYFTSRVDRLTLQASGRFTLIVQDRSRISHAAQSLASGQQVSSAAQEVRREGTYLVQALAVTLRFDDGTQQQCQLVPTSDSSGNTLHVGQDVFTKVSDSTLLPSTDRLKKDMEDIAKGLKIAGAIGGVAIKAVKTIHDTIQSTQNPQTQGTQNAQGQPAVSQPAQQQPPQQTQQPVYQPPVQPVQRVQQPVVPQQSPQGYAQSVYCDQCGTKARPGKRFCSTCGASLV